MPPKTPQGPSGLPTETEQPEQADKPEQSHEVSVVETAAENIAEQAPHQEHESIAEKCNMFGIELDAGTGEEDLVPKKNEGYIADELSLDIQKRLAVAFKTHQPVLLEGGTSLGKSTTVAHMASELNWSPHSINMVGTSDVDDMMGRYTANPDRHSELDPEYVFADGSVTAALREAAAGHKVVLLIDEINAAPTNVLIRLHAVIDQYEKNGAVTLTEDANETIPAIRDNLVVVALANPPSRGGSRYAGREPLDMAQLRRWVYHKLPNELPEESLDSFTRQLFGLEVPNETKKPDNLPSAEHRLTLEQVASIDGIDQIQAQYLEFHKGVKELLARREIGDDQPQPFTFDDREEPIRVVEFIANFYNGDITETTQAALKYYYASKLAKKADREAVGVLIETVRYYPPPDARRRTLSASQPSSSELSPDGKEGLAKAAAELEKIFNFSDESAKGTHDVIMAALAGNPTKKANDLFKDIMLTNDISLNAQAKSNIGFVSPGATFRDRLEDEDHLLALAYSISGLDSTEAWQVREAILKRSDPKANSAKKEVIAGLAGIGKTEAQDLRNKFYTTIEDPANTKWLLESLIGLESPMAWVTRGNSMAAFGSSKKMQMNLARSLVGLDSARAGNMRRDYLVDPEALLMSYAGVDTDEAWEKRTAIIVNILDPSVPNPSDGEVGALVASLSGLTSVKSWGARQALAPHLTPAQQAQAINGNYLLAAVRAEQRRKKSLLL